METALLLIKTGTLILSAVQNRSKPWKKKDGFVNARYVYGVSATPKRGDDLEKIIYMLLGPIRHSYTAKERATEQGISHYVYPRYTRVIDTNESKKDINGEYSLSRTSSVRNDMILEDTRSCVHTRGRDFN